MLFSIDLKEIKSLFYGSNKTFRKALIYHFLVFVVSFFLLACDIDYFDLNQTLDKFRSSYTQKKFTDKQKQDHNKLLDKATRDKMVLEQSTFDKSTDEYKRLEQNASNSREMLRAFIFDIVPNDGEYNNAIKDLFGDMEIYDQKNAANFLIDTNQAWLTSAAVGQTNQSLTIEQALNALTIEFATCPT